MLITLSDRTQVLIREIRPDDKSQLSAGLARLSPASAYRRFMSAKPSFSSKELRYLTEVDGLDHYALVALDADGHLVAVGRFVRLSGDPAAAEVAVTVADHLQGKGLGKSLGLLLADAARNRGLERFSADMLAENLPAHRLMRALTERLESTHDGSVHHIVAPLAA